MQRSSWRTSPWVDYEGSVDELPSFLRGLLANVDSHALFQRCRELWENNPQLHALNLEAMIGTWV